MYVYCTQFVSTNERRAAFVLTNPIEVLNDEEEMWTFGNGRTVGPLQKHGSKNASQNHPLNNALVIIVV